MERLPDEYEVTVVTAAGSSQEKLQTVPLYELDRVIDLNNLTSVYVPPVKDDNLMLKEFSKLKEIIAELRGPNGCPWDKEQTHESLKKYLIEETFEVIEAINNDDIDHLIEELGDVLLQAMLHAQIGEDDGYFSIADVIESVSDKMIRRHPHVFGDTVVSDSKEVLKNWQQIKADEKGGKSLSILDGITKGQPNLLRAYELQRKAAKVGFDWKEVKPAIAKVKEELTEFENEIIHADQQGALKEFGDLLFSFVNVARFLDIHPEEALHETNEKFIRRFRFVEQKVSESGKSFEQFTLDELDRFWEEAKEKGL
jgi:tetrapyrrole methylase family protein/MazG family protein